MSQFSYKYFKQNYKRNNENEDQPNEQDVQEWTFWKIWALLILLLLLVIAGMLFSLIYDKYNPIPPVSNTYTAPVKDIVENNESNAAVFEIAVEVNESVIPKSEVKMEETKKSTLYHYSRKVLPASPLPVKSMLLDGQKVYGPVSIDEYMYFVRETGVGHPKFIDLDTYDIIVSYAPVCFQADCPIYGISSPDISSYVSWLENVSGKKLEVIPRRDDIVLKERDARQ